MAEIPTFQPFGGPTEVMESMYRAQDQRESLMSKARERKQQELTSRILEAKQAEWEMMAPLRQKQTELQVAETGAQLYTANIALEEEKALANDWPALMEKVKAAQVTPKDADGMPDYASTIPMWADVMAESSKYANTARGKQAWQMAKSAMDTARLLNADQTKEKIARLKAERELTEVIVDNKVMKMDAKGNIAQPKGAYPDPDQAREIEQAKAEGRASGEISTKNVSSAISAGLAAQQSTAKVNLYRNRLSSIKQSLGPAFKYETMMRSAGGYLGWGDQKQLADMQHVSQMNRDFQLEEASRLRGQGSITDNERKILEGAILSPSLNYEANMAIADVILKFNKRDEDIANLIVQLRDKGYSEFKIDNEITKYKLNNPVDLTGLYSILPGKEQTQQTQAGGGSYLQQMKAKAQQTTDENAD